MNERIKELAEQSGMNSILNEHASEYGNGTIDNTPYPELQAFAALIITECIQVSGPADSYVDEWFKAKADSVNKIKKHFGVE